MLKKNQSISRANFPLIYRKGKRLHANSADVLYLPNHQSQNQYAIVISTKIDKLATRRNWMRRQIKPLITANSATIKQGYQIVIIIKSNFYKSEKMPIVKKEILFLLAKI